MSHTSQVHIRAVCFPSSKNDTFSLSGLEVPQAKPGPGGRPQRVCVPQCGQLLPQRSPCACVLRAPSSGPGPAGLTTVPSTRQPRLRASLRPRQGPACGKSRSREDPPQQAGLLLRPQSGPGKWLLVSTLGVTVPQLTNSLGRRRCEPMPRSPESC